ncbi:hypothetical protein FJZ19_02545 [Candidatus Pacearchaeota archaeon]|nr:hypothetical protein [Candidatus Pacearchaeota archaeon]
MRLLNIGGRKELDLKGIVDGIVGRCKQHVADLEAKKNSLGEGRKEAKERAEYDTALRLFLEWNPSLHKPIKRIVRNLFNGWGDVGSPVQFSIWGDTFSPPPGYDSDYGTSLTINWHYVLNNFIVMAHKISYGQWTQEMAMSVHRYGGQLKAMIVHVQDPNGEYSNSGCLQGLEWELKKYAKIAGVREATVMSHEEHLQQGQDSLYHSSKLWPVIVTTLSECCGQAERKTA